VGLKPRTDPACGLQSAVPSPGFQAGARAPNSLCPWERVRVRVTNSLGCPLLQAESGRRGAVPAAVGPAVVLLDRAVVDETRLAALAEQVVRVTRRLWVGSAGHLLPGGRAVGAAEVIATVHDLGRRIDDGRVTVETALVVFHRGSTLWQMAPAILVSHTTCHTRSQKPCLLLF
jgi:hypothetical protein